MPPLATFEKTCLALALTQLVVSPAFAAAIMVDSNTDDGQGCTLREAIVSANRSTDQMNGCTIGSEIGTDTITFSNSLASNTITLAGSELDIVRGKNIEINASDIDGGLTIDADGDSGVFEVNSAALTLESLNITGGSSAIGGGIITYSSNVSLSNSNVSGNSAGS